MKRNIYRIYVENIVNDITCKFYDTLQSCTWNKTATF